MDSGNKEKFEAEKRKYEPSSYHHSPSLSSDWANRTITSMNVNTHAHVENHPMAPSKGDTNLFGSSCSSASIAEQYCPTPWDNPTTSQPQPLGNICTQTSNAGPLNMLGSRKVVSGSGSSSIDHLGLNPLKGGGLFLSSALGIPPQGSFQPSTDSTFIDRARLSCFSGYGGSSSYAADHFGASELISPFSRAAVGMMQRPPQEVSVNNASRIALVRQSQKNMVNMGENPKNVSLSAKQGKTEGSPLVNERKSETLVRAHDEAKEGVGVSSDESDEVEFSGGGDETSMLEGMEPFTKGPGSKKRKMNEQAAELTQVKGTRPQTSQPTKCNTDIKQKGGENQTSSASKSVVKQSRHESQASDPPKEYIHVRARRGQATNSHSLAERVRREKISERMKFLQDLVPGCSKVTGKAVMLDEIINYVQSLQRQVEFLSMKLATVNPRMDLNIEGFLAKDLLHSRAGPSSVLGFSPDMSKVYPQPHPSPSGGLIHAGLPSMAQPSDALRRTMSAHLTGMSGGFKEPAQLPNVWEDELHNVVQMTFSTGAPSNSQDVDVGSLPPSHTKVEL